MRSVIVVSVLGSLLFASSFASAAEPESVAPAPVALTPAPAPATAPAQVTAPAPAPNADTPPASPAAGEGEREQQDRRFYLSLSPLHLIIRTVELTGEFRVHEKIGLSAIAGAGSVPSSTPNVSDVGLWEAGGQFVSYPVGHFDHGMQLGAEAIYMHASATDTGKSAGLTASGIGTGYSAGAFVGYKLATKPGFTFNVQGGVQYMSVEVQAAASTLSGSEHASATLTESRWAPLANINVGWSF